MIRQFILVSILLLMTSCSALEFAKTALGASGDGPSLEVDTTVGRKNESVVGRVGSTTEISTESLSGGINTTNVQDIPPWVVLLLILGWLLPDPRSMYSEVKTWFRRK